jgi:hypothetical protein
LPNCPRPDAWTNLDDLRDYKVTPIAEAAAPKVWAGEDRVRFAPSNHRSLA